MRGCRCAWRADGSARRAFRAPRPRRPAHSADRTAGCGRPSVGRRSASTASTMRRACRGVVGERLFEKDRLAGLAAATAASSCSRSGRQMLTASSSGSASSARQSAKACAPVSSRDSAATRRIEVADADQLGVRHARDRCCACRSPKKPSPMTPTLQSPRHLSRASGMVQPTEILDEGGKLADHRREESGALLGRRQRRVAERAASAKDRRNRGRCGPPSRRADRSSDSATRDRDRSPRPARSSTSSGRICWIIAVSNSQAWPMPPGSRLRAARRSRSRASWK